MSSGLRSRLARLEQRAERAVLRPLPVEWHRGDGGDRWATAGPALGNLPGVLPLVVVEPDGTRHDALDLLEAGIL